VSGLRREEVAMLASISVEYYTRLERGNASGVSDDVLEGIARALQLDEAEHAHLFDLVRAANTTRPARRRPTQERVRPPVRQILDAMTAPAYVRNGRLDILAGNTLGYALCSPVFSDPNGSPNMARFIFYPHDRRLSDLIGELSTRSEGSASSGPRTTSSSTAPAPSGSTIPWSATSPSPTRRSTCRAAPASGSSSTRPSLARHRSKHSTFSPAGPRPRTNRPSPKALTSADRFASRRPPPRRRMQ
jgi:transcriptional regulator with XRE-family HTH domain